MDAFDSDVLIYAAEDDHPLGRRVASLFPVDPPPVGAGAAGTGSLILLAEVLSRPLRLGQAEKVRGLVGFLSRLELLPLDRRTAEVAASVAGIYGLKGADAVHLATAIAAGADRFVTNNRKDFRKTIAEIDVTYPEELPEV